MKLRTKLLMFTAATALSVNMAFAAINPQSLAESYIAEGYTYVEVKVGPTQTKVEAVKGTRKAEVIYDNATGAILKQEFENADADYIGRSGTEIESEDEDFLDDDENDDDETDDDENDDDEDDDDENDDDDEDDDSDESDDDEDDDHGGSDESDDDEGGKDD